MQRLGLSLKRWVAHVRVSGGEVDLDLGSFLFSSGRDSA